MTTKAVTTGQGAKKDYQKIPRIRHDIVIGQSISFNQRKNIMNIKVNTYRTTAKAVGTLYILGFVVGIAGSALGAPGQLDTISARSMMIAVGALLWVLAAAGDAAHGVLMFPVLKQNSERIALG